MVPPIRNTSSNLEVFGKAFSLASGMYDVDVNAVKMGYLGEPWRRSTRCLMGTQNRTADISQLPFLLCGRRVHVITVGNLEVRFLNTDFS